MLSSNPLDVKLESAASLLALDAQAAEYDDLSVVEEGQTEGTMTQVVDRAGMLDNNLKVMDLSDLNGDLSLDIALTQAILDYNLQVVNLTDLDGDLPLAVVNSTQILWQTENWEHSTLGNPSWPAGGHESLGFPTMVKNDHGLNPDGKYYLYYSHHDPTSGIGVAVADSITGPYTKAAIAHTVLGVGWTDSQVLVNPLYRPGGVPLDWIGHYSSPSVVWNADEDLWFMYFHYYNHYWGGAGDPPGERWSDNNPGLGQQMTALATTPDLSSHNWTIWTDPVWSRVSVDNTVPVLPTTDEAWMDSQSSYHAIQRLPDGQWLAFMRGTNASTGRPTVGFATSNDGRSWDYFPENPVIAPGKSWTVDTTEYRPKFIGYLGENGSGVDEYLVAWAEHSHPNVIYSKTTDFKTFERDSRGYASWGVGDGGLVSTWREGDRLYLFSEKFVHEMILPVLQSPINNPPTSPANLLATRVLHDGATVWWNPSTDADGDSLSYDVQYRREDLTTSWISTSSTSGTRMTLTGLDANTAYRVRVRASDGQDLSAWNTQTNFFTTDPPLSVPGFFGEVGMLTNLTDQAQTVLLQQSYIQPVVFAQSPSYNGVEEVVVRVSDVQLDRFTIYLQEPSNRNGTHTTETVSYVVLEAGTWQLPGGTLVEVGTLDTSATAGNQVAGSQFEIVTFANPFSTAPVVLSQIQTANFNPLFVKTRQDGTTSSGFQLALDVEELVTVPHGQETIGYLAIEAGAGSWGGIAFEAVTTPAVIDSTGVNLSFGQNFGQAPRFLSSLGSYLGQNPAQLRYDNLTGSGVQARVEEETTSDAEVSHLAESISYLALGGNGLLAGAPLIGQVLGETGTLTNLTDQPQTILLHATYNNPVVFAQSASRNGAEPVVVRVTDVQADRFTIYLQEPSDRNGAHTAETVSYMVLEAGQWQLSDGTLIEVGQVSTSATVGVLLSDQWETVSLATPWADSPVVLSQVQTANDPSFVKTRQQDFAAGGFQIALEGEEDDTSPHGLEAIGYLAIEAGRGDLGVVEFEAFTTAALFNHAGTTWTFNESFDQTPGFLSSLSSYIGSNAVELRYDSLNESGVRVYVEEDTTFDAEIHHTAESISYLAFVGNGLLTGQPQAGWVIGQAGTITGLTDQPQVIQLDRSFVNPVVLVQPPSYNGLDEVVVRVSDVQSDRFTVFLQEPSNRNGTHSVAETASYLVLEAGQWQLADGSLLEAGNLTTNATVGGQLASPQWTTVQFTDAFDTVPVVFSQVQTTNDTSFVKTRQQNPSGGSVEIALEGEEAAATPHGTETIGYLALQPGAGSWGGLLFEAFTTPATVSDAGGKLSFTQNFPSVPGLFASISGYAGSNPAALRHAELTDAAFKAFVEEDTTLDEEKAHVPESISYLALGGSGLLLGDPAVPLIGEVGQVTDLTEQSRVIQLGRNYIQPVVFAQSPSYNGVDEVVVRVSDVQSDRFTIYLQEPSNHNGTHTTETVSYVVLEAGRWQMSGGVILEVGTVDTSATAGNQMAGSQFQTVSFANPFSATPVVLSQVQTANFNPLFVKTRQDGTTSSGFQLALDVEELVSVPHGQETIGYLAIEAGAGSWGNMAFEALTTPAVFDDTGVNLSFSQNFGQAPRFLSSLASYIGQNPAQLRYDNLTGSGVQVRVEEETTSDAEVSHGAESISYLALGSSGLLFATDEAAAATTSLDPAIFMFGSSNDPLLEPNRDPLWLDALLLAHVVDGNTSDTDVSRQGRPPGNVPSLHGSNTISSAGPVWNGVAAWMSTFRNGLGNNPLKAFNAMALDWDFIALEHDDADLPIRSIANP